MRRELLYPILLACAETLSSEFWARVLTEMAYGNCPSNTYISNGALTAAAFAWEIPTNDDTDFLSSSTGELVELLQEHLGIYSEEDTAERQEIFYQILASKGPDSSPENWQELKKIYGKDLPIAHFVANLLRDSEGNLNKNEALRKIADINLGLGLKNINNDDIVVKDGRIHAILPLGLSLETRFDEIS